MMLYDVVLVIGLIAGLGVLAAEAVLLTSKKAAMAFSLKPIAVIGVLALATAVISGTAVAGYVSQTDDSGSLSANGGVVYNAEQVDSIKQNLAELRENVEIESFDMQSESQRLRLVRQIERLENQLDDLTDENEDLEDDVDFLSGKLNALFPGGFY